MKLCGLSLLILSCASSALASVYVSAPSNNANVATSVQYVATASTSCSANCSLEQASTPVMSAASAIRTMANPTARQLNGKPHIRIENGQG